MIFILMTDSEELIEYTPCIKTDEELEEMAKIARREYKYFLEAIERHYETIVELDDVYSSGQM